MKIRNLLAVVAMFSLFLFGIGTAHAITGVADDVPGFDIVMPIICEATLDGAGAIVRDGNDDPVFGGMNTIWAIADAGGSCNEICTLAESVCTPADHTIGVVSTNVFVYDKTSVVRLDTDECWSKKDVIANDCQTLIKQMANSDQEQMLQKIGGRDYFVGYVLYSQADACDDCFDNRFVSWVYLQDVVRGFSAGFNAVSGEWGFGPGLTEDFEVGITAHTVFPRYFILNNDAETFNWWIFLLGRNQASFGPQANLTRKLACFWCDEFENCTSKDLNIPNELNIINVANELPALAGNVGFPKRGFAFCDIVERGFLPGQATETVITGTMSFTSDNEGTECTDPETYSLLGWSYQRAIPVSSPQKISVIHPIHRTYCARGSGGDCPPWGACGSFDPNQSYPAGTDSLPPRFSECEGNNQFCSMTGPVPDWTLLPLQENGCKTCE